MKMLKETNAASEHKCSRICYHVFSRAAKILRSPPSMARTDDRRSYLAEETRLWSIARTSKGSKQSTKK